MRTPPAESRHRVVALTDDGFTTADAAEALGTSAAWEIFPTTVPTHSGAY